MRSIPRILPVFAVALIVSRAPGQQVTIGTPFHSINSNFWEQTGVSWGFNAKGISFGFGGANPGVPPFGSYQPNGLMGGFAFGGGDVRGFMNFAFGQGSQTSLVNQTPMVTLFNGVPGSFSDTSTTPFVYSFTPVVGGGAATQRLSSGVGADAVRDTLQRARSQNIGSGESPIAASPAVRIPQKQIARNDLNLTGPSTVIPSNGTGSDAVVQARASSAGRGAPSVAEARRMHAAEQTGQDDGVTAFWERGVQAEESGNAKAAKIYYQIVARRSSGDLKEKAIARIEAIQSSSD